MGPKVDQKIVKYGFLRKKGRKLRNRKMLSKMCNLEHEEESFDLTTCMAVWLSVGRCWNWVVQEQKGDIVS